MVHRTKKLHITSEASEVRSPLGCVEHAEAKIYTRQRRARPNLPYVRALTALHFLAIVCSIFGMPGPKPFLRPILKIPLLIYVSPTFEV